MKSKSDLRKLRFQHLEYKYAELCLGWSHAYLTTSDWYCGPNLRWLYTFEPALYRKYAKRRLPVGWTALDALWHVGLGRWLAEARSTVLLPRPHGLITPPPRQSIAHMACHGHPPQQWLS